MPRIKSEIFDNYAKIALDKGIVKKAQESSEIKKYKDDSEARMGSDDLSTIEALYGVKPDGQNYEYNIMEEAHPNSVIVAPAYDKLNGLVENNIERQNIIVNITRKPNTGNGRSYKYAKQNLTMELVRIANHMDNINNEELRKLADECLQVLAQQNLSDNLRNEIADLAANSQEDLGSKIRNIISTTPVNVGALLSLLNSNREGVNLMTVDDPDYVKAFNNVFNKVSQLAGGTGGSGNNGGYPHVEPAFQTYLNIILKKENPTMPPLNPDGKLGKKTLDAVHWYEKKRSLNPSPADHINSATISKLYEDVRASEYEDTKSQELESLPASAPVPASEPGKSPEQQIV